MRDGVNSASSIIEQLRRGDSIKERANALGRMTDDFKQSAPNLRPRRFTFIFWAVRQTFIAYDKHNRM